MKKFIALLMALVMAMSLATVAWGAGNTITVGASGDKATLAEAIDVAVDGDTIQLLENVTLSSRVTVSEELILDLGAFTITAAINDTYGAVYVGMAGNLTINATTGGITNTAGHAIGNYGVVTINGGTFTGDYALYNFYNNTTTFGTATINGGTFQASAGTLAVANCGELTVDGGSIESLDSSAVLEVTDGTIEELLVTEPDYNPPVTETTISDGTVESLTVEPAVEDSIAISGGSFGEDVSEYVAGGKQQLANGTVVTTPAASATDPVLYVADNSTAGWSAYYIATGMTLDKLTQGSSDNCLPCYLIDGDYYVEVKEAAATYKLVYGNKTVFLKDVPSTVVCYVDTASVLTVVDADDAECGDFYIADLDEDDVYYISYDKKGEVDGIWVAEKNGSVQILVKGKIVNVEETDDVDFMDHDWKGYEVVNYEYVSVKCSECDKVAKLYANATAAGKKAVPVAGGWITYADATDYGSASAPSTDKTVTSADTFDAGIAMYVGMSIMAAAGGAVVIGKKKD